MTKTIPLLATLTIATHLLLSLTINPNKLQAQSFTNNGFYNQGSKAAFEYMCQPKQNQPGYAPPKNLAEAEALIDQMLDVVFMERDFEVIICHDIDRCFAQRYKSTDYIVIDPDFLAPLEAYDFSHGKLPKNNSKDWVALAILAHEIGHIRNNHTTNDELDIKQRELKADQFAGFLLCQLGATLKQAQQAMYHPSVHNHSVGGYPTRAKRLAAVKEGWSRSCDLIPDNMVFVKGGTYTMGCTSEQGDDCSSDEKPTHQINLSDFYISKYEVTNAEYTEFLNAKGNQEEGGVTWLDLESSWCKIEKQGSYYVSKNGFENHPVMEVTWYGATAYAKWKGMRLPTEAEWEYAARGGQEMRSTKYAGSNDLDKVAWHDENSYDKGKDHPDYGTHEVGTKVANELGLYDVSGNVYEWCSDWYSSDYYNSSPSRNPRGPSSGSFRVIRGGSWYRYPTHCRVANRNSYYPANSSNYVGFRLASSSNGSSSQF